ncbi:phage shock protein operon transcriptional activator [Desulforhopalus singaporensis]|uniref:Psp operon transcriptional activator n=1 Tax=Desulforhopalus singaporensis TaxID=91360 RepID=A0A1H0LWV4_9BACT|nr:phage shock protein operon transcriptional activator [Desulforhopalus singaporensis]SDO72702.1 psp operon transcriptional activator [Desulforhopalus singaporensis]
MNDGEALGQSESFLDFQEKLSRVAPVDRSVLLLGERGTGKELAARRLHYLSNRWQKPFVTLNCATLAPTLIESELFGHDKGAFTGAEKQKTGRFEMAHGGTLFLDEIGSIPLIVQEKILRVVEYSFFERVGSSHGIEVDVRIVGATNEDLPALVSRGRFKRDLLDRLSFEVIFLPPLRHRKEDIMVLANHFAARMSFELGLTGEVVFSTPAVQALTGYRWPGNIRELKNVVERAVYRAAGDVIDEVVFDPFANPYPQAEQLEENGNPAEDDSVAATTNGPFAGSLAEAVAEFELDLIRKSLERARYNRKKAASALGLSYDQFRGKLRKYGDRLFP